MRIKEYLLFSILAIFIAWSQFILLKPHLQYGFSDVDWGFLSIYKTENPYSPSQFIEFLKRGGTLGGIYTHQIYYIGIQNDLFGLDFKYFQITTHVFKILAIFAVFPLLLAISGNRLVAFISTILFAFSYSAVGTMYTVVTSSDYSAIFSMGIFVIAYWYVVKKNIGNWFLLLLLLLLLILTLFLSTERMYQLPLFIALTEAFLFWQRKKLEKNTLKRLLVMFLPLILVFLARPMVFLSYFLSHGIEIVQGVSKGNWNILLTPFVALGSIIIPHNYTKFLGLARMDSFESFLDFLISGPLFVLVAATIIIGSFVFKKSYTIFQILSLMILFSVFLYISGSHFVDHLISTESVTQALVGLYILAVALVSFRYWQSNRSRILIGLFVGPLIAFLYIVLTWVGAATSEVFAGAHRYLTIPAQFISLFLGTLFVAIFFRLFNLLKGFKYLNFFAITPLVLLMLFYIDINVKEIQVFFNYQLYSGFGAADKQLMRDQLLNHLDNLSNDKPSLFYFDFMEDNDRGYYYDNTLLGGFASWMLWHPNINFNRDLTPKAFWNNPELLKASMQTKNGEKVIIYGKKVYNINDFYAFKLKDKKLIDIKEQIVLTYP